MSTVLNEYLDLHLGVKAVEDLLGNLDAGKDALFLDEEFALAVSIGRDATERGVVAIAYIFGKRQINQSVN